MGFRVRDFTCERKFASHLRVEAIERAVPMETITSVLQETGAQEVRLRKLSMPMIVLWLICLSVYTGSAMEQVFEKIVEGLRLLCLPKEYTPPNASSLCNRRYQLGVRPMAALFHRVCRPVATAQTAGAFAFGLRLVAVDGHRQDLPDTPENAAYFGRPSTDRGEGAFPQALVVALCECGTHVFFDAGIWPCHTSEHKGALRLARSLTKGMLVMWDRGLHAFALLKKVRNTGAHVLARVPANVKPLLERILPDGSYLAWISPSAGGRKRRGEGILVRILCYTIDAPTGKGHKQTYRLMTTLTDPLRYPAKELALLYHERWEEEGTLDELETHPLAHQPLRSRKPLGVVQELYGVLIAHYAVRSLMHEAALRTGVDPDRLSFTRSLHILRDTLWELQIADVALLEPLVDRMLQEMARHLLPERRSRSNPRVVKRKMSNFPLKRTQHRQRRRPPKPLRDALHIQVAG